MGRKRRKLAIGAEVDRAHREVMRLVGKTTRFTHTKGSHRRMRRWVRRSLGGR